MKQLTGLDASFLYMETGSSFGHVSSLSVYARPDDPEFRPYEAFRAQLDSRMAVLEPFRRRLVEVPLQLDHPWWIIDPEFDMEFHLRHMALPEPGDQEQLCNQVARIIGRPMDRSRPLWEVYVIEGLAGGDFAILTKVHHATIDGASGAGLLAMLLDTDPSATPPTAADPWVAEPVPSTADMLMRTSLNLARRPGRAARVSVSLMRQVAAITRNQGMATMADMVRRSLPSPRVRKVDGDAPPVLPTRPAPATPFNKAITAHRRLALGSAPLSDVKALKDRLGVTVNDVVMAVCAGALRNYLLEHDALPAEPLVAMVPVSIRTGDEADMWTNRVSGLVPQLPTHLADPLDRVRAVHEAMNAAKADFELMPADALVQLSEFAPPALATRALRVAASMRMADRLNPPVNLVISNVPGPRSPLYFSGALLKHFYPVSTVVDGQGLNITVQSYLDTLDFGLVACRELVPDLEHLVDLCLDEIRVLIKASAPEADQAPAAPARTAKAAAKGAKASTKPAAKRAKPAAKAAASRAKPSSRLRG